MFQNHIAEQLEIVRGSPKRDAVSLQSGRVWCSSSLILLYYYYRYIHPTRPMPAITLARLSILRNPRERLGS